MIRMPSDTEWRHRDFEKLGLLCRWALLAMACVVILVATWAGLSGSMVVFSQIASDLVLSDALWYQDAKTPSLAGFFKGPPVRSNSPMFLYQDHFRHLHLAPVTHNNTEVAAVLPSPLVGKHTVVIRGVPYGAMAFRQYRATMWIVSDPVAVYLLDADLLARIEKDDHRTAIRIVKELDDLGQPVLIFRGCPGSLADELASYKDIPHVFSLRKNRNQLPGIIRAVTKTLRRHKKTPQGTYRKPYVITGDVETAMSAARLNHYTHLVAPDRPPAKIPELLRVHLSAADLSEHLTNEHAAHPPIQ